MKLKWKAPSRCEASLILFAEPKEGTRFYLTRPQGKRAGDKWTASISVGCAIGEARRDDAPPQQ